MRDVYGAYWNLAVPAHLDAYNRNLIEIDPLPPILLGGPTTMDKDPIEGLAHEMNAHYTEFLEELDYLLDPRNDTKPGTFGTPPPGETTS